MMHDNTRMHASNVVANSSQQAERKIPSMTKTLIVVHCCHGYKSHKRGRINVMTVSIFLL